MHGGKSATIGPANANYKTGRYSKYLPHDLAERFEASRSTDELLELRDDLALLDTRITALLDRVATNDQAKTWREFGSTYADLRNALRTSDPTKLQTALAEMDRILAAGQADYTAWGQVLGLLEQRRKIVESESKRMIGAQQMLTITQGMMLVANLLDSVKRHVDDPRTLAAISADVLLLTRGEAGG